jgi:hypothetical protein
MAVQLVPFALQNASHSAALFRQAMSGMYAAGGVLASNELLVTQQATPAMSIVLGPGRAKIVGTAVSPPSGMTFTTQAMYDSLNDAGLSITVATSNPTNPRIDAVYMQIQDSFYSGAANQAIAGIQPGVAAASPVAPAIPTNAILIAYIAVGANVTSIVTANVVQQTSLAAILTGIRVVPTGVYPAGSVLGQYIDDAVFGLRRSIGGSFTPGVTQMPYFNIVRDKVPSISNATDVQLESSYTWQSTPINRGGFIYSAGVVTVPFAGVYNIFASFAFAANATGSRRVQVTKNGASTGTNTILSGEIAGSSVSNSPAFVAGAVLLAAGDTLAVSVWQNSGAALSAVNFGDAHTPASSFFTIVMQSA